MDRLHIALALTAIILAAALAYALLSANQLRSENASLRAKLEEEVRREKEYGKQLEQLRAERESLKKRIGELEGKISELQGALEERGRLADLLLKPVVIVVNNASGLSASVEARPGYARVAGVVYVIKVRGLDKLPQGTEVAVILRQANPVLGGLLAFTVTRGGGQLLVDNLYPTPATWKVYREGGLLVINTTVPFEDLTLSQMYVYLGVASTVEGVKVLLPEGARLLSLEVSGTECTELTAVFTYSGEEGHFMALAVAKGHSAVASLQLGPGKVFHVKERMGCEGAPQPLLFAVLPWPA